MIMRMAIFSDQNFFSLLCYLDDILMFAPNEQLALQRLEMVFERLKTHNLKLAPKRRHFMRSSLKVLGDIVTKEGISTDPERVKAIADLQEKDLIVEGTDIPSPTKIRSFLGMVGFYQQFFEGYSGISNLQHRPLTLASNSAAAVSLHPPISSKAVSAVLEHSLEKGSLPPHAVSLTQLTQSLLPSELSDCHPLPKDKLMLMQH